MKEPNVCHQWLQSKTLRTEVAKLNPPCNYDAPYGVQETGKSEAEENRTMTGSIIACRDMRNPWKSSQARSGDMLRPNKLYYGDYWLTLYVNEPEPCAFYLARSIYLNIYLHISNYLSIHLSLSIYCLAVLSLHMCLCIFTCIWV